MNSTHPSDDHLIAYALGDLDPQEPVVSHLATCPSCRAQSERLTSILAASRGGGEAGAPMHVLVEILSRQAAARNRQKSFLAPLRRPLPALAAAVVAVVLFGAGYLQGRRTSAAGASVHPRVQRTATRRAPLPAPPVVPFTTVFASADNGLVPDSQATSPPGGPPRPAGRLGHPVHAKDSASSDSM
jgi:anti-sigma factor RsiW